MRTRITMANPVVAQIPLGAQIKMLKEQAPQLFKVFFKKIYDQDHRFGDWKLPLLSAAMILAQAIKFAKERETAMDFLDEQTSAEMVAAQSWAARECPMFFIEPDLFDACINTNPPQDIRIGELSMPYEAMTFVFPRGHLEFRGNELHFVMVRRFVPGITVLEIDAQSIGRVTAKEPCLFVDSMFAKDLTTLSTVIDTHSLQKIVTGDLTMQVRDYRFSKQPEDEKSFIPCDPIDGDDILGRKTGARNHISSTTEDNVFCREIYSAVINLLLAMESKPEIVERQRKIKHMRRDRHTELWKPNIIGKRFRIEVHGEGPGKGEHASPRTHWRRGHWRSQGRGHRLDNCVCGHSRQQHFSDSTESFCLDIGCQCRVFISDERRYEKYERTWIMPVLVMGSDRKEDKI